MKIVLATNALLPADREGGPAHSNFYLAKALRDAGTDVQVVTTDRNGPGRLSVARDRWIEREGIPVFYATTADGVWVRSSSYSRAVNEAVAASDLCVMSGVLWNYTGLVAALACRRNRVPYLTMTRGLLSPWALRHKGAKKRLYWGLVARRIVEGSTAVIALAEREVRDVRNVGVTNTIHIVPNGAFLQEVSGIDSKTAAEISAVTCGSPYVLFLGRVHSIKGLDILIPAFDAVAPRFPDVHLVIAGAVDAAYQRQFESIVSTCRFIDRLHLIGNVNGARKAALVKNSVAFALTSYSEGLPVAVLEALSASRPVLITPGCNLPEVKAANAGVEVSPDLASVARGLAALLEDPSRRAVMGENAGRLAAERFSWDAAARRLLEICRSALPDTDGRHTGSNGTT